MPINTGVIYSIRNITNNKIYIGSTINYKRRIRTHIKNLRQNEHHCLPLQNSWNKYGEKNFVFEVIEDNIESNKLRNLEQEYLDVFTPYNHNIGYNVAKDSILNMLGVKQNQEWIDKRIRKIIGRKTSEETKKKQSEIKLLNAKRGRNHPKVKPIYQYTKDLVFIREWLDGTTDISNNTKIKRKSIENNLSNRSKTAGGFIWLRNKI